MALKTNASTGWMFGWNRKHDYIDYGRYEMKILIVYCSCMLLCCSAVMAELNGSDDFNDNIRDPAKWTVIDPLLSETNNRLEFTSTGVGDEDGAWVWTPNSGSYTQDWTVTVDANNYSTPSQNQWSHVGVFALNSTDDADFFGTALGVDTENGCIVLGGGEVDGTEHWDLRLATAQSATLRISYDATAQKLSSSFDAGDGFISLTNFKVIDWSMNSNDTFIIAIAGFSEGGFTITSGEMYFDNFEAVTLPGISNHLSFVVVEHQLDYNDPLWSGDDQYKFFFEADTDNSVTSIMLTTPGSEAITVTNYFIEEGVRTWEYMASSPTPLLTRFADGNYTVEITLTNGAKQSTIIPLAEADGTTPLADVTMQPLFSSPAPLHDALFVDSIPITLKWVDIDPHANIFRVDAYTSQDIYKDLGMYSDILPFADGPLSTRSIGPEYFGTGVWQIQFGVGNITYQTNSDGVLYGVGKNLGSDYDFTVLDANEDYDGDGLPNGWESRYFNGPTNAIASLDSDLDGHNNLQESITGMDPTNAASVFMITNSIPLADNFLIEWPSAEGRIYNAYWSTNLTNSFLPMGGDIGYPQNSYTDTLHSTEDECFYRVDVRME